MENNGEKVGEKRIHFDLNEVAYLQHGPVVTKDGIEELWVKFYLKGNSQSFILKGDPAAYLIDRYSKFVANNENMIHLLSYNA